MKKFSYLFLMCLLGALLVPVASATIETTYTIMPYEGPYDQKITLYIRCFPLVDNEPKTVYVFWDKVQINKLTSSQVGKTTSYQHLWDIQITPPAGYASEGKHLIDFWIENKVTGEIVKKYWQYTVTDGLPSFSAWDRYIAAHPEILDEITGPKGDKGNTGEVGPRGVKGDTGARGQIAQIDYAELWASIPPEVVAEMKGDTGARGEPASNMLLIVSCAVSVVISSGITWFFTRAKEEAE